MSGWIDVRAPLPYVYEKLREKTHLERIWPFVIPVNRFARLIRKSRPARNAWLKFMRKIDIFLRGQSFLNLPERIGVFTFCQRKRRRESKS